MTVNTRTRRSADATGRSTGSFRDARFKKQNAPPEGGPWFWLTRDMVVSYAMRAMSQNAWLIIARICDEHMAHAGSLNGELTVTFSDFEEFGVRRGSIKSAIAEAVALGFIEIAQQGAPGRGPFKGRATLYRIAWLPTCTGDAAATNWKRFTSLAAARKAADAARKAAASKSVVTRQTARTRAAVVDFPRLVAAE